MIRCFPLKLIGRAMTSEPTRRRFLAAAAGLVPGLALLREQANRRLDRGRTWPPPSELPPRVVGLRSLGGAFRFDPPGLLVQPGETVRWLNMGDFHTVSAFHPDNAHLLAGAVPLRIPEGAEPWHSGMLGLTAGSEFQHRFTVEGVYDYFCQPHYGFGMVGRIVVGGPRGGPAVRNGLDGLVEAARREMPPVEAITSSSGRGFEWAARVNGVLWTRIHEGDLRASADAVARGIADDRELHAALEQAGADGDVKATVGPFREGAVGGVDYEELVRRADALKEALRRVFSGPP